MFSDSLLVTCLSAEIAVSINKLVPVTIKQTKLSSLLLGMVLSVTLPYFTSPHLTLPYLHNWFLLVWYVLIPVFLVQFYPYFLAYGTV